MAIELTTYPTERTDADEAKWSSITASKFRDGVYYSMPGYNDMVVYSDQTGLQVKVRTGLIFIGGFDAALTSIQTLSLLAADASNDRIDRVVARLDRTTPATIYLDVLTGTPAVNPAVPALTKNSTVTEVSLGQVRVPKTASSIISTNVTDDRSFTAPRGLGTVMPGVMGDATGGMGDSPFPASANHWHPLDPLKTRQLVHDAGEFIMAGHGSVGIARIQADGRIVSRAEYGRLFQKFGTTYGAGDGSSTFQLPDFRRSVPRGAGIDQLIGQIIGSDTYSLTVDNFPDRMGLPPGYSFAVASGVAETNQIGFSTAPGNVNVTFSTVSGQDGSIPVSLIQRSFGVNWLITT